MMRFIFLSFIVALVGCSSLPKEPEDFVLIYIASSLRTTDNNLVDPVDKNAFFIEGAVIYNEFVERGVPSKNIFFLYQDGRPDFDEELLEPYVDQLKEEFSGQKYNNEATIVNLQKIEKQIQRRLSKESNFFLVLDGHGLVDRFGFKMRSEHDKTYLRSGDIRQMIKDNRGRNHIFIGSCYSGHFLNDVVDIDARVVTAAPADKAVWLDRDMSFAREYFTRIPRNLSSSNFLYDSAFNKAVLKFKRWGHYKSPFIKESYEGTGLADFETLGWEPKSKILGDFE